MGGRGDVSRSFDVDSAEQVEARPTNVHSSSRVDYYRHVLTSSAGCFLVAHVAVNDFDVQPLQRFRWAAFAHEHSDSFLSLEKLSDDVVSNEPCCASNEDTHGGSSSVVVLVVAHLHY